jgi:hypothetical protein
VVPRPADAAPPPYYSDRHELRGGPVLDVGAEFWAGFTKIWRYLKQEGFLVAAWGSGCGDRLRGDIRVDSELRLRLSLEIGLEWTTEDVPTAPSSRVALDAVEFFARYVQRPLSYEWHEVPGWFNSHRDYWDADRDRGLADYAEMANALFRSRAHPFRLEGVTVVRRGEQEYETLLRQAVDTSGDVEFDQLLETARTSFFSLNPEIRKIAVEKAWDAFERMKTILDAKKDKGSTLLIERAAEQRGTRDTLLREARELTEIGNGFRIRHH